MFNIVYRSNEYEHHTTPYNNLSQVHLHLVFGFHEYKNVLHEPGSVPRNRLTFYRKNLNFSSKKHKNLIDCKHTKRNRCIYPKKYPLNQNSFKEYLFDK